MHGGEERLQKQSLKNEGGSQKECATNTSSTIEWAILSLSLMGGKAQTSEEVGLLGVQILHHLLCCVQEEHSVVVPVHQPREVGVLQRVVCQEGREGRSRVAWVPVMSLIS